MKQFADFLSKSEPVSLQMTVEVINERMRLERCIKILEFNKGKQREVERSGESLLSLLRLIIFYFFFHLWGAQVDKSKLLEESFQHVVRLEQIALNADSLSTHAHLDFLIKMMEERGDAEKIQKLKEIKSRADRGVRAGINYAGIMH